MSRARQLVDRGNNYALVLDSSASQLVSDGGGGLTTIPVDVGERLVLNGTNDASLNSGFSILQEDATDNPDVEVTSFIDPSDTLIFTSPPKIETNPSFRAFLSANQAVAHGTFTKINFDVVSHDIGGNFDISNNRYQPSIPGYYRFFMKNYAGSAVDIYAIITMIYKNGVGYQSGGIYSRIQMNGLTNDDMYASTLDVSEVFYMDGDDYIEGYCYQASEDGQACSVFGDGLNTTMGGYLIARSNVSPQTGINI